MRVFLLLVMIISNSVFSKESYPNYIENEKRLSLALDKMKRSLSDKDKLSAFFKFPLKISFSSGRSIVIKNKVEFKNHYESLMSSGLRKALEELAIKKIKIGNYQGVMIDDIWFNSFSEMGDVFIVSINQKFQDIESIESKKYNAINPVKDSKKKELVSKFKIEEMESGEYELYKADINNDGQEEYIHIYLNSGTGKYSGINKIFGFIDGKPIEIDFEGVELLSKAPSPDIMKSKRAKDWKEIGKVKLKMFHSRLGKPFLFYKGGKVYINFSENKVNYTYLWVKDTITNIE